MLTKDDGELDGMRANDNFNKKFKIIIGENFSAVILFSTFF